MVTTLESNRLGALSPDDIALLRTGFIVVKPLDENFYASGAIALVDMARMPRPDPLGVTRVSFYFSYLYARWVMHKAFILHIVSSSQRVQPEIQTAPETNPYLIRKLALPEGNFPTKFLVLQSVEPGKEQLNDFMAFRLAKTEELRSRKTKILVPQIITGTSSAHLGLKLGTHGVPGDCLPDTLGGTFDSQGMFRK